MFRGSRKHVLDWTSRPEFCVELLQLLTPVEARITARSNWMPKGHGASDEARLETFGPKIIPGGTIWSDLQRWWLASERGATTPNWDIAVGCEIEGEPGLVLVEAKANDRELNVAGKAIDLAASPPSVQNHERIGEAINQVCGELRRLSASTAISRDTHYQLSNRVAFAWKLASLGIPTVLVYLGFLGDQGIDNVGLPFTDSAHWSKVFAAYADSVVPPDLFERRLDCGPAPTWFLVRSRSVLESSERRLTKSTRA